MTRFFLLCCLLVSVAHAETFNAKVIGVIDGDTILVLRGEQKLKVRLANIDAPEKDQAWGKQSRAALVTLVAKKQVEITGLAMDQYARLVGLVSVAGVNVNQEQVRLGMAWEYSHYHADHTYQQLQREAQAAHRGLWQQSDPLPPWQWRKSHPATKKFVHAAPLRGAKPVMMYDLSCGNKHRCSQMKTCDEAYFYFIQCEEALDGNGDGIPCDELCAPAK